MVRLAKSVVVLWLCAVMSVVAAGGTANAVNSDHSLDLDAAQSASDAPQEDEDVPWDPSPYSLKNVRANNLGIVGKVCAQYCRAGVSGLDLWMYLNQVCVSLS